MDSTKLTKQNVPNYYCIVPCCTSTKKSNPEKLFLSVPFDKKKRRLWFHAIRRNESDLSMTSGYKVCADHFNLEEDMANWTKFKLMGGQKVLKDHVVPHIFDCQDRRKENKTVRPVALKRKRQELVNEAIASTSQQANIIQHSLNIQEETTTLQPEVHEMLSGNIDKAIQVRPFYRSKHVSCVASVSDSATSPLKNISKNVMTSPLKKYAVPLFAAKQQAEQSTDEVSDTTDPDTTASFSGGESSTDVEMQMHEKQEELDEIRKIALKTTLFYIEHEPRLYTGIPKDSFYIINLLQKASLLKVDHIMLSLKKIRTNDTFSMLAHDFGISESFASKIFSKTVPLIAMYFKKLIVWNDKNLIRKELPAAFIARYSNVECIIDCLEIQIQKPSDAVKQALTWSNYKKCNTLKYLVSCTPDGIINFISHGYGGRANDSDIVEASGFLDLIAKHSPCAIMADRGFKRVEKLVIDKGCSLVRPPSVQTGVKSTKAEVIETKRIASLRIHVERLIKRLREFSFLAPHSCIPLLLIPLTDDIINIASAITNLQPQLIKK